jgi:hypothetical protein
LLLCRQSLWSYDGSPRDADWVDRLDECARHDPDNAHYDYLAARFYWDPAAEVGYYDGRQRVVIKDAEGFHQGILRFARGQTKRCFWVGDAGYAAVADFLSHAPRSAMDNAYIVNCRTIHERRERLLDDVWVWQNHRAEDRAAAGHTRSALSLSRESLCVVDQYQRGGAAADIDASRLRADTTRSMMYFAEDEPEAVGDSERRQIVALREAALLQYKIDDLAFDDCAKVIAESTVGLTLTPIPTSAASPIAFLVAIAPPVVVLLLFVGLSATLLSRRLAPGEARVVGPVGQVTTLVLAAAATVALFGLAPAGIIGRPIQAWFFTAALLLTPLVPVLWVGWSCLRRRIFRFSIRAMLIFTLSVSLYLSLLAVIRPEDGYLATFPFPLSIPARGWKGLDAGFYYNWIKPSHGVCAWAAFQWMMYGGVYWSLLLWAGLLAAWHGHKARKARRQTPSPAPSLRRCVGALLRTLGQPALVASALLSIAYLILAPGMLQQVEDRFQGYMETARHPETYGAEMEQAVQRVRSDAQVMATLRAAAKAEASQSTVPDGPQ